MPGDDTVVITIQVGKLRGPRADGERPGMELTKSAREVIQFSASDLEHGALQGQCVMHLHRMMRELVPEGRW